MTIDTTVRKVEPPGWFEVLAGGGIAAVVIFSVGVFLSIVPILGWVLGPALMILAGLIFAWHVYEMFSRKPSYSGHCPYCGEPVLSGGPGAVGQCAACKNRFVQREDQLYKLA